MDNVTVVFRNGNVVSFAATEFDVGLGQNTSHINKYPYKDGRGEDSFIYLQPISGRRGVSYETRTRQHPLSIDSGARIPPSVIAKNNTRLRTSWRVPCWIGPSLSHIAS